MIEVRGASLVYDDHGRAVHACDRIDLKVEDGEFVGILGPSGSGKSSLLYLMCGLKTPTSGDIVFRGRPMGGMTEDEKANLRLCSFGFVFQYPYLLGYLSALENVLVAQPQATGDSQAEALAILERLGMSSKAHRLPHELSGGEKQRICIARALFGQPEVVFADEPTANLDHVNGAAVVETLVANRGSGSLIMVTHDPSMLEKADRVVTISDGKIV